MGYASKAGRARISTTSPSALGVCGRCGIWYNRIDLRNQIAWRGNTLQATYIFVCNRCYDTPNEQLRAIALPADPVPIAFPQIEPFLADETDYRVTAAPPLIDPVTGIPIPQGDTLVTLAGDNRTTQPLGRPAGIAQAATQPQYDGKQYGPTLAILSLISDGFYTITATCSAPHGLVTNSQINVQGATVNRADGAYSVTVGNPMTFTYTTQNTVTMGNILAGNTRIWSIYVGLPRGYDELPKTGI